MRILIALALFATACGGQPPGGFAPREPPATPSTPAQTIDVTDMMGAFPSATFYVVASDGVRGLALLNHATRYTIPTTGDVQVAAGNGQLYVADRTSDGARLRVFDMTTGTERASRTEHRELFPTGIGHGAIVVEPTTSLLLAMFRDGSGRVVEAYEAYTLTPVVRRRIEAPCGDRLLAGGDRVVLACYATGALVVMDGGALQVVDTRLGRLVAAASSQDGTTLVGRADGTLARMPAAQLGVATIAPVRPGRLVPDGIAAADSQRFVAGLITSEPRVSVSTFAASPPTFVLFPESQAPTGGLLAGWPYAYWVSGKDPLHIDLAQGFAETMASLATSERVLPGAIGDR